MGWNTLVRWAIAPKTKQPKAGVHDFPRDLFMTRLRKTELDWISSAASPLSARFFFVQISRPNLFEKLSRISVSVTRSIRAKPMIRKVNLFAQGLLRQRSVVIALFQSVLIVTSLFIAWMLRFDFQVPYRQTLLAAVPVLVAVRLLAISRFNLLHGWWRYTGVSDALDIVKAVVVGSLAFFVVTRYGLGMRAFPISIYPLEALVTGFLLCGVRLSSRIIAERSGRLKFHSARDYRSRCSGPNVDSGNQATEQWLRSGWLLGR